MSGPALAPVLSRTRAHASHPLNGIVGGGMLWCALALLVSQPPQPCLGYAQRMKPLRTPPPTRPPLKGGRTRWRRPPCQSFYARLRRDAVQCCAKPCCAMLRYAVMCSWERAHRCAAGPPTRASRAGVALRASVATRPPQRWNGLPENARVCATARLSSASRVQGGGCIAARMVLCRARRVARGGRAARLGRYATSATVERSA